MADNMMRIAGRTTNGVAKAVRTDDSGNLGTQINHSNIAVPVDIQFHELDNPIPVVEKNTDVIFQVLFDEHSIRDTTNHRTSVLNIQNLKDITIEVSNSCDVVLELRLRRRNKYLNDMATDNFKVDIPANSGGTMYMVTSEYFSFLKNPLGGIVFEIRATTAPTTGSVSVTLIGRGELDNSNFTPLS